MHVNIISTRGQLTNRVTRLITKIPLKFHLNFARFNAGVTGSEDNEPELLSPM